MYVCICHAVTDRDIKKAVSNGVKTLQELRSHLQVATHCDNCAESVKGVLNQAVASRST